MSTTANSSLETSSARLGSDPEAELGGGLQENIDLSGEAGDGLEGDSGAQIESSSDAGGGKVEVGFVLFVIFLGSLVETGEKDGDIIGEDGVLIAADFSLLAMGENEGDSIVRSL